HGVPLPRKAGLQFETRLLSKKAWCPRIVTDRARRAGGRTGVVPATRPRPIRLESRGAPAGSPGRVGAAAPEEGRAAAGTPACERGRPVTTPPGWPARLAVALTGRHRPVQRSARTGRRGRGGGADPRPGRALLRDQPRELQPESRQHVLALERIPRAEAPRLRPRAVHRHGPGLRVDRPDEPGAGVHVV